MLFGPSAKISFQCRNQAREQARAERDMILAQGIPELEGRLNKARA